ncbi:hypothetical protein DL96DRAFT_1704996 [Flagelloscypha sp. PMI_526]|nr:hypothetical protein DL96DRAFT_1704996 [Flagelloscypha sp. PMI_526]
MARRSRNQANASNGGEDDDSYPLVHRPSHPARYAGWGSTDEVGPLPRSRKWHIVCVSLHLFFAFLHVALVVVMNLGVEKKAHIPLGYWTTFWGAAIQIILQTFAILFLAGALFASQKIFMRRILLSHQTLASSHDQSKSWLGLGSALTTLLQQGSARSGVRALLFITIYLSASAVVKVTTSALFQLTPVFISDFTSSSGTSLAPIRDFWDTTEILSLPNRLHTVFMSLVLTQNGTSIDTSTSTSLFSSVGLQGNTLYDLIPVVENSTSSVSVNTYSVNAQCQSVDYQWWNSLQQQIQFDLSPLSTDVTRTGWVTSGPSYNMKTSSSSFLNRSTLIPLFSFINITDSAGNIGLQYPAAQLQLQRLDSQDPWVSFRPFETGGLSCPAGLYGRVTAQAAIANRSLSEASLPTASMMLCTITMDPQTAPVNATTRALVNAVSRKNSSNWSQFPNDLSGWSSDSVFNFYLGSGELDPEKVPRAFTNMNFACNATTNQSFSRLPSIFESYMFSRLNIFAPPLRSEGDTINTPKPFPSLKLHDLEIALEDYIAAFLFTLQKANETRPEYTASRNFSVNVPINRMVSELTLRTLPVYLGLGASLVMLAVALWIVITTPVQSPEVDSLGLLEILWLSGSTIVQVSRPTEEKLRHAGLSTNVKLGENASELRQRY